MGNPINGSLDIWKMNLRDRFVTRRFNSRRFTCLVKGLEALRFVIPIISENFKKMGFLLFEVAIIRDS